MIAGQSNSNAHYNYMFSAANPDARFNFQSE
jgi:hypothetical protein